MHVVSFEAAGAMLATTAPLAAAAITGDAQTALDLLPVSAGLSGAIVAALKGATITGQPTGGRWRGLATVFSGASAAVFAAPALAGLAGVDGGRVYILAHFLVGLLGSTLCDEVVANRTRLLALAAKWLRLPGGQ